MDNFNHVRSMYKICGPPSTVVLFIKNTHVHVVVDAQHKTHDVFTLHGRYTHDLAKGLYVCVLSLG